jgi:hypothetical protein
MMSLSCNLGLTENQKQPDHQIERQKTSERVTSTLKAETNLHYGVVSGEQGCISSWNLELSQQMSCFQVIGIYNS